MAESGCPPSVQGYVSVRGAPGSPGPHSSCTCHTSAFVINTGSLLLRLRTATQASTLGVSPGGSACSPRSLASVPSPHHILSSVGRGGVTVPPLTLSLGAKGQEGTSKDTPTARLSEPGL